MEEQQSEKLKVKQWIEVELVDGKCKTSYYPTNDQIVEKVATLAEEPP